MNSLSNADRAAILGQLANDAVYGGSAFAERLVKSYAALIEAVEVSDLYINDYCHCAPSRIKAEARGSIEQAMGVLISAAREAQA